MIYQTMDLTPHSPFPNSRLPVLYYPRAIAQDQADTDAFCALFTRNGWQGIWVNGVYDFDHFHAQAHEALGCATGWAKLRLGGPQGQEVHIQQGDAVLLPAGMGHCRLEASTDFVMVGAYPPGQAPDMQRGSTKDFERLGRLAAAVPLPQLDPVFGEDGPVCRQWK